MSIERTARQRTETAYRSLTQIIYEELRQNIYDGVHKPGEKLSIVDLAQQFNASTIPVREALRNLQSEGLVHFWPNRGASIRELSAAEVRELFLMRIPLEVLAAKEAARRASPDEFDALQKSLRKMEKVAGRPEWHALHEQFHNQLYALSGLPRLSQFVAVLRGQMRPYAQLYLNDAAHMRETHAEHFEIVAAARAGSVARLNKLVKEHLKRPARIALAALGEKVFPEFAPGASD